MTGCRARKLHEAEERRKQEEERRLKKQQANEAEQKRQADAMARKKEYEEAERLRKVRSYHLFDKSVINGKILYACMNYVINGKTFVTI